MKESKNHVTTMYESIPAVAALNKVPGFDPLKFLRRVISPKTKEEVLRLDLPYKKLWFRLAHPKGRIRVNALRITEQLAIYEAQVYLDLNDGIPVANFTSQYTKEDAPDGLYIQAAQQEAINEALTDAGFGLQFADVEMAERGMRFGSEIPLQGTSANGNVPPVSPAVTERTQAAVPAPEGVNNPAAVQEKVSAPAVQKTVPAAASETRAATENLAAQEKTGSPEIQEKQPLPAMQETVPDELPVTAMREEALPIAPAAQEQTLPVPPAAQTETLPVPPAIQRQEPATMQEEEMLPISGPVEIQNAVTENTEGRKPTAPAKYTQETPIEEIVKLMTYEEAQNVVVDEGTCAGWTVGEVARRRPPSLKFYLYGGYHGGNILKAAAKIMLDARTEQKAG